MVRVGKSGSRRALALLPLCLLLLAGLLVPLPPGGPVLAQIPSPAAPQTADGAGQLFPQTGFRLGAPASDPFGEYFVARGGVGTFGYPASRPFTLQGVRVQFFQRYVMQELPSGVGLLNILDEEYMPYTDFGTAVIPPVDPQVATGAPPPGTPGYGQAVAAYLESTVPNAWEGQPVGFLDAYLQTGVRSGATDPAQQALLAVEVLGFPTSAPAPDPRDPNFIYQRFQRSVLQYNGANRQTQPLLMADYFKSVITGRELPPELSLQAQGSRYYLQYRPGRPGWVARPADLPDTDMTQAFEPEDGQSGAPGAQPTAPLAPPTAVALATVPPLPTSAAPPTPVFIPPPPTPILEGTPGTVGPGGSALTTTTPTRNPERPVIEGTEPGGAFVGQDIVIRGRNFGDQPGQVLFTGKLATAQVWANDLIVVTVPAGAADGTVRIRRPDGVLSNAVGFAPSTTATPSPTGTTPTPTLSPTPSPTVTPTPTPLRPTLTAVEPDFGPVGSSILIQGSGFVGTTGNFLVGNLTAPVQLWSDSTITVLVPSSADTQAQLTQRIRVIRADGALVDTVPISCFIVSPGTPTASPMTGGPQPTPTPTPTPPAAAGC
jgi:hypothetical protein